MRNAEVDRPGARAADSGRDPELVYANDVRIMAEPGGVQLTFTRSRASVEGGGASLGENGGSPEVIARIVLPHLAARRLLRLLPRRLELQQALAEDYALATEEALTPDPFLAALENAELDDEPFTDEEQAAVEAGWEEFERGETIPWADFRRGLLEEDASRAPST